MAESPNPLPVLFALAISMKRRREGAGFTLVELLVAILIIALLAGLLMPAVMSGIHAGRRSRCMMQLRQIATGLTEYAADNNGTTVVQHNTSGLNWSQILTQWDGTYAALNRNTDFGVWRCPENHKQKFMWGNTAGKEEYGSYGINGSGTDNYNNQYTAQKLSVIANPSQLYMIFDATWNECRPYFPDDGLGSVPPTNQGVEYIRYAHGGKLNMIYADGHGESLTGPLRGVGAATGGGYNVRAFSNGIHWMAN